MSSCSSWNSWETGILDLEGNSDEIVHYGNWDVSKKEGYGPLLIEGIPAKTLCAKDVPAEGGLVDSLYASHSILLTSPCIKD